MLVVEQEVLWGNGVGVTHGVLLNELFAEEDLSYRVVARLMYVLRSCVTLARGPSGGQPGVMILLIRVVITKAEPTMVLDRVLEILQRDLRVSSKDVVVQPLEELDGRAGVLGFKKLPVELLVGVLPVTADEGGLARYQVENLDRISSQNKHDAHTTHHHSSKSHHTVRCMRKLPLRAVGVVAHNVTVDERSAAVAHDTEGLQEEGVCQFCPDRMRHTYITYLVQGRVAKEISLPINKTHQEENGWVTVDTTIVRNVLLEVMDVAEDDVSRVSHLLQQMRLELVLRLPHLVREHCQ